MIIKPQNLREMVRKNGDEVSKVRCRTVEPGAFEAVVATVQLLLAAAAVGR